MSVSLDFVGLDVNIFGGLLRVPEGLGCFHLFVSGLESEGRFVGRHCDCSWSL